MVPFTFVLTTWHAELFAVRMEFRTGRRRPTRHDPLGLEGTGVVLVLVVRYWPPDASVSGVRTVSLESPTTVAFTPTDLARFPWTRWLRAAEAFATSEGKEASIIGEAIKRQSAVNRSAKPKRGPRRPGAAGAGVEEWRRRESVIHRARVEAPGGWVNAVADAEGVAPGTVKSWHSRIKARRQRGEL